jgi:hypothetical protein
MIELDLNLAAIKHCSYGKFFGLQVLLEEHKEENIEPITFYRLELYIKDDSKSNEIFFKRIDDFSRNVESLALVVQTLESLFEK